MPHVSHVSHVLHVSHVPHVSHVALLWRKLIVSAPAWPDVSHPHTGSRDTGTGVNRPQLDQVERLTISFIRSHVGSMGLLPISSKFWPLTSSLVAYKEPLITEFLFEDDLIPQSVAVKVYQIIQECWSHILAWFYWFLLLNTLGAVTSNNDRKERINDAGNL